MANNPRVISGLIVVDIDDAIATFQFSVDKDIVVEIMQADGQVNESDVRRVTALSQAVMNALASIEATDMGPRLTVAPAPPARTKKTPR